jgi:uncharacterized protein (TIGR02118 family)
MEEARSQMVKISVFYPNKEGTRFDIAYYRDRHMPMVRDRLTPQGLRGTAIDKGLAGGAPGQPAPYHCVGHLLFDSVEAFQSAFRIHGKELMADIPNYTSSQPVVQISEVVE